MYRGLSDLVRIVDVVSGHAAFEIQQDLRYHRIANTACQRPSPIRIIGQRLSSAARQIGVAAVYPGSIKHPLNANHKTVRKLIIAPDLSAADRPAPGVSAGIKICVDRIDRMISLPPITEISASVATRPAIALPGPLSHGGKSLPTKEEARNDEQEKLIHRSFHDHGGSAPKKVAGRMPRLGNPMQI